MPNRLARETSPYLQQHADNPVDWHAWGEEALRLARDSKKPILLSVGYSACHWCHVMAHESFENADIARLLNENFVPVKLDREERPDVDKVYMAYVQAMTGHGGWPLSVWLTPDLKPFYGGTYFPPSDRSGRAGFPTILQAIARGWRDEREKLVAESERVLGALRDHQAASAEPAEGDLANSAGAAFEQGFSHYFESFDPTHAGFGGAPKFPRAANLDFLFRVAALQGVGSEMGAEAVRLATATLRAMARGGIHDHVGGGFHRYSVDDGWFVPHFEKMLYDNALLASAYAHAALSAEDPRYADVARSTLAYMDRAHASARLEGMSREPIVEMLIPSTVDDTLAPAGKYVASLFCQHFAYALPEGKSWDDCREHAADLVIDTVNRHAPNFKASILGRRILSPLDLEREFGLSGGDIFHGALSLDQLYSTRPLLGASSPATSPSSVDLPLPDGPTTARNEPAGISSVSG